MECLIEQKEGNLQGSVYTRALATVNAIVATICITGGQRSQRGSYDTTRIQWNRENTRNRISTIRSTNPSVLVGILKGRLCFRERGVALEAVVANTMRCCVCVAPARVHASGAPNENHIVWPAFLWLLAFDFCDNVGPSYLCGACCRPANQVNKENETKRGLSNQ